ncbi:MAG: GntR family transcriptional regulator [Alphaproteobacteria bacterium]|jgi:GntR family transcriptional regulator|nr:GntR family transcriptional regulator [Alphaproteobacteria bacterium]
MEAIETPGYRPLYRQVYDVIVRRIAQGEWRPGESLPSEIALARDLSVSQGTVRKVLDALTAEKLLERRQGKGTYIAENTQERALFRFFRLARPGGDRLSPHREWEKVRLRPSKAAERAKLDLGKLDKVVEIRRVRSIDGRAAIRETIIVPAALAPGLENLAPLPNTVYSLYQSRFGLNITQAREEISAGLADAEDAAEIDVTPGQPLLVIDRVAISLEDRKVEWRQSRCLSGDIVYAVTLT